MIRANQDIRNLAKENNICNWQIALKLGIGESTLVRKLRVELTQDEKDKVYQAINQLKEEIGK